MGRYLLEHNNELNGWAIFTSNRRAGEGMDEASRHISMICSESMAARARRMVPMWQGQDDRRAIFVRRRYNRDHSCSSHRAHLTQGDEVMSTLPTWQPPDSPPAE